MHVYFSNLLSPLRYAFRVQFWSERANPPTMPSRASLISLELFCKSAMQVVAFACGNGIVGVVSEGVGTSRFLGTSALEGVGFGTRIPGI